MLISFKADVNLLEKQGIHPIMIGCLTNRYESVKILLEHGVNVNWRSSSTSGQQPIRFASKSGSLKLIKMLLSYGADMEADSDDKFTPLMAAIKGKNFEVAEFYFSQGAKVTGIARDGECVIHEAIKSGNLRMVQLALDKGAPLDIKTPNGKSTLQLAKASSNKEVEKLIENAVK